MRIVLTDNLTMSWDLLFSLRTTVHGVVNYVLGMNWKDCFRFRIISGEGSLSQAHIIIINQTKSITEYTFHCTNLPYTLTIIDTSGSVDLVIQEELKETKLNTLHNK